MDFINFTAHEQQYAVRIDETVATVLLPQITTVPGTIDAVRGMFSYLGELIPVVDLSVMYFGEVEPNPKYVIIVQGSNKYGILATAINDIIRKDVPLDVLFLSVYDIENTVMNPGTMQSNEAHIELF